MGTRRDWLVRAWAVALAVLLLGPALGLGYVLSYDMVWVPDLALRPEFLGLGSGLPRAVPSDALVAVLDEVVPGMLLQKVVLLGSLVAAGARRRAARPGRLPGRPARGGVPGRVEPLRGRAAADRALAGAARVRRAAVAGARRQPRPGGGAGAPGRCGGCSRSAA